MDARIIRYIQAAFGTNRSDTTNRLVEAIVQISGDPLTVQKAKDGLSAVLGRARNGVPQAIGSLANPNDIAVVISVRDLAELVTAARRQETLGEALDVVGFKAYSGDRVVVGQGLKRERLQHGDRSQRSDIS